MTLGLAMNFSAIAPKHNQLDVLKIKNVCSVKDTAKRMKRQMTDGGKIFSNHIPDKRLTYRIYKELPKLNNQKTNKPI